MKIRPLLERTWTDLKLQTKLVVAFMTVLISGSLVATAIVGISTKYFFTAYINHFTDAKVHQWHAYFLDFYKQNNNNWAGIEELFSDSTMFPPGFFFSNGKASLERIVLQDEDGHVLVDSNNVPQRKKAPKPKRQVNTPIYSGTKKIGTLVIGINSPTGLSGFEQKFYNSVVNATIVANGVATLCAILLAIYFSRRFCLPLVTLTQAADKFAEKDFKYRLFIPWNDEIGSLTRAFNSMADVIESKEEAKNRLIADVAHELRTPITVLRGNLESLQVGVLKPSQEVIISLHDEVLRLSRLINDLQQISLAESGKLKLNLERLNAASILQRVVTKFKGLIAGKDIRIELTLPLKAYFITADSDRITQVLSNIMNNAVRHTPQGGTIIASLAEFSTKQVIFSVADNGPGIDPKDRAFIFERFYRGSKSRNRSSAGAGLGLAIAKSLTIAHGGMINVECPPTKGCIFSVIIPKNLTSS